MIIQVSLVQKLNGRFPSISLSLQSALSEVLPKKQHACRIGGAQYATNEERIPPLIIITISKESAEIFYRKADSSVETNTNRIAVE